MEASKTIVIPQLLSKAESGKITAEDVSWLAPLIDHTLLKPEATRAQLKTLCEEAKKYGFATVCVNSSQVSFCAELLKGSKVKPIAVIGFPLGAATTRSKVFETIEAIENGAQEIDMVIPVGKLRDRDHRYVYLDIRKVVLAAQKRNVIVKVILETSLLSQEEKIMACAIAKSAGAAFVKTSTGFSGGGATIADISLMRSLVGIEMGVKASGGIRSLKDALLMVQAGANRLGASSSVAIVNPTASSSPGEY